MAVFTTSDKLGQRPTVSAAAPIQGYNAGAPQRAAIDAAGQLRQTGKQIEQFGANITTEEERRAKEAQAEQEKQDNLNDAILEAQMKSAMLRASLKKDTDFNSRNDIENFEKEDGDTINQISSQFIDKFSPKNQEFMKLYADDFKAKRQSDINQIVRTKTIDRNNAIEVQTMSDNLQAYAMAGDNPDFQKEIYNNTKQMMIANHIANGDSEESFVKKGLALDVDFGKALLDSLPLSEKIKLLAPSESGGEDKNLTNPSGLIEKGNIDLNNRQVVKNSDGTISTERSFSVNFDGQEVLLPLVIDGEIKTEEEAIQHYKDTGENLGKFKTSEDANKYAEALHNRQDTFYNKKSYVDVVRGIESGGNPNAKNPNSSAKGIYQWTDATARQYGLLGDGFDYRGDPEKEDAAFKQFTEDNRVQLYNDFGREPTDQELYLAHQQGATGAAKLILSPNANAVDTVGRDQVLNNGGETNWTNADFVNHWSEQYNKKDGMVDGGRQKTGTLLDKLPYGVLQQEIESIKSQYKPELQLSINDALSELSQTGNTSVNLDSDQISFVYGDDAPKIFTQINEAKSFGETYSQMKTTPLSSDISTLESMKPSGDGFLQEQQRYKTIAKVISEKQKQLTENPSGYVKQNFPDVERAYSVYEEYSKQADNGDESAFRKADLALQNAVKLSLDKQEQIGVLNGMRQAISKDQAENMVQQLGTKSPQEKVQYIDKMKSQYGEYWQDVYMDLVDAGMSDNMSTILSMNGADQVTARNDLIEADAAGKDLEKSIPEEVKKGLDADIFTVSQDFYATAAAQPNNMKQLQQWQNSIKTLALSYLYSGKASNTTDAATKAVNEILGKKYNTYGTLRIPVDYNQSEIISGLSIIRDTLKDNIGIEPKVSGSYGGTPSDIINEQYRNELSNNASFILSSDEKYVAVVDQNGFTVHVNKNGTREPLLIALSEISSVGLKNKQVQASNRRNPLTGIITDEYGNPIQ